MKNIIIFDLDGTLWDTVPLAHKCMNIICERNNIPKFTFQKVKNTFGLQLEAIIKMLWGNNPNGPKYMAEYENLKKDMIVEQGGFIYPFEKEVLQKLKNNYDLYIVSNSFTPEVLESYLKFSDTQNIFSEAIAAGYVGLTKAKAISYVIKKAKADNAIYVGDMYLDRDSAKEAGIPFIQCLYGFGEDLNEKYKINSFSELENVIKKIFQEDRE